MSHFVAVGIFWIDLDRADLAVGDSGLNVYA